MWSIGIYTGPSPFTLAPAAGRSRTSAPALTAADVRDVPAAFVADPFMMRHEQRWWMFFEVLNQQTGRGEIGLASSRDGSSWRYEQIVLALPFHLSYPYVFRWRRDHFLVPEALGSGGVQLFRASSFPEAWEHVSTLLPVAGADPSPFRFGGRWWMFVCTTPHTHDTLNLYHAERLTGPWHEHPRRPVVAGDRRRARPAGRVLVWRQRVVRFAQDCEPAYGTRVRAFSISALTPTDYREEEVAGSPILRPTGEGWNAARMHHVDAHRLAGAGWIACVDGHPGVGAALRDAR
jgi:hypothetical protein